MSSIEKETSVDRYRHTYHFKERKRIKPFPILFNYSPSLPFPPTCGGKVKGYLSFVKLVHIREIKVIIISSLRAFVVVLSLFSPYQILK